MLRRSFVNRTSFTAALLAVALCGLLSTPTFADRSDDKSRGHDSGDRASAKDSRGSSHGSASTDRGSWRSGGSRDNSSSRVDSGRSSGPSVDLGRSNRDDSQSHSSWSSSSSRSDNTAKVETRSNSDFGAFGRQDTPTSRTDTQSHSSWSHSPSRVDRNQSTDTPRIDNRAGTSTRTDSRTFQKSDSSRLNNDTHRNSPSSDSLRWNDHNSRSSSFGRDYRSSGGISSHVSDHVSWPRGYRAPTFSAGFYHYSARPRYRPARFGFYIFDDYDPFFCRTGIYFYYGYFPYISYSRVFVRPYVVVDYYDEPVTFGDDGYYLSRNINSGLDNALSDIRKAWMDGRSDLIKDHVSSNDDIAILLDGKYDYSVNADDYMQMTSDALDQMQTVSFTWEKVRRRTDGEFTAYARHAYRNDSGDTKVVYVSYTLQRSGGDYYIDEVGSSKSRLF